MQLDKNTISKVKELITAEKPNNALIRATVAVAIADTNRKNIDAVLLNEFNYKPVAPTNFIAGFYGRLREGYLDDKEFTDIINAGSKNTQRHKSHYNNIRVLANAIRKDAEQGGNGKK